MWVMFIRKIGHKFLKMIGYAAKLVDVHSEILIWAQIRN